MDAEMASIKIENRIMYYISSDITMSEEVLIINDPQYGTEFYLFQIEGLPHYYVEPIYGRVWSDHYCGRWLKSASTRRGYSIVSLWNNRGRPFTVHSLVFKTIYGLSLDSPLPNGLSIDHIDRDIHNNSISNLRLATKEEQFSNSSHPMKNVIAFKDGHSFGPYSSINECSKQLGLHYSNIINHLKGSTRYSHVSGYTFKFM